MANAKYAVGQIIKHKLFNYRGVIVDVDPIFQGDDEWYEMMALSRPNKNAPWYYVLVHGSVHRTYVAEENMEIDTSGDPVVHPDVDVYFSAFSKGKYCFKQSN